MAELPSGTGSAARGRERLLLYLPGHRSTGKVPRDVELLPRVWQLDDLQVQAARTVTAEEVVILTARNPAGRAQLDREIKIGDRLRLANESAGLSRLIGFDDDKDTDPPLALVGRSGVPLAQLGALLPGRDRLHAAQSLLIALRQLSRARVVHRALCPETVLWDESQKSVQITGFHRAAFVGESRAGGPCEPPWCAPEQASGAGRATTGDDTYAAALLLFWMHTGEQPVAEPTRMRERLALQDDELRRRLDGMFNDEPQHRPSLEQLTRRWQPSIVARPASPQREDEARREFTALRARQRADPTPLLDPSAVAPALVPAAAARWVAGFAVVLVAVLVIVWIAGGL